MLFGVVQYTITDLQSNFLNRFGVGKRSMESKIIEEVAFLLEAVRKKEEKPFDIQVNNKFLL